MTFLVSNPDNKTDSGTFELDGADSITTADVGGFTYVFVAGGVDDGVSVFRLNADGTLTPVFDVTDDAALKLDGARGLSTAMVDGNSYLFVAGQADNGVSVFRVGTNGALTSVANAADDATFFMSGVTDTATASVGSSTYLFTAGTADDGISIFRVLGNGHLTNVGNLADNGTIKLDGVDALTTVNVGGSSFLIAAGGVDNGISVFSIAANGTLTNTNNFSDSGALNLGGASDVTTAVIGGVTYVFVAGATDNGISVFSMNSSGILTNVSNVTDSAATLISGVSSLSITTIGTSTYLLAGGNESGLSMFRIENGSNSGVAAGSLTFVDNIADDPTNHPARELGGATSVGSGNINGTNYFLGAGSTDDGVSSFRSTATGQLYFFGQGGGSDARLAFVNNDGGNQTSFVDDNPTTDLQTPFPEEVGVDTAAGLYFALVNGNPALGTGGFLVRGSLSGGAVTSLVAYDGADNISGNDDDEIVNALHVDVINHRIYVGIQDPSGGAPGATGIRQYSYNPTTGAIADLGFLVTVTSSGKPQEGGFDVLDVRDFDVDSTNGTLVFTELLTGGAQANGIFRLNTATPNTIVQLVAQSQFPDDGSLGYITDVEIDNSTHLVYFDVESQHAFPNAGYVAGQNKIYWISETATGGTATALVLNGLPGGGHFYPGDMVFDQGTRQLYVESEETDAGSGPDTDDVIYVFQLTSDGHTANLINTISLIPSVTNIAANIGGMVFNDIPALTGIAATAAHAGEQGSAITLLTSTPTITDVDGDHLSSATVQITQGLFASNESNATDDHLQVTAAGLSGTNITATYNAATGTLTLSGYDTLAHYQQALAGVQYFTTGDNPTNFGLDPTRTFTWTVSDGAVGVPGGSQNSATTSITLDAVNDAPVNAPPGAQSTNEDISKAITGLSVSDVDANPAITNVTVTLSVLHGTLTLATNVTEGITSGEITNNGTDTVTITATLNEINATLASGSGLTYASVADYNGSDTLHIVTNDGGNTGSGGAKTDTDDVAITINPVVDIANDSLNFAEDSGTHTLAMPNNDTFENTNRAITAVTQGAHGTVTINDNGTPADNTDDFIVYTQVADYNGSDSFTYTVTSGGVTETATVNVTISPVADITGDNPFTNEDSAITFPVQLNDSFENAGHAITNISTPTHGTAVLNDTGTPGDTTDDTIVYTPNADYNGTDSFTYTITSGGVTETATVNMTISAVADIVDDSITVAEDSGANALNGVGNPVSLLANDTFESAGRFISAVTQGLHGSVSINDNGTAADKTDDYVVYTPTANYNGPDSFTYTVTSGGVTETATVNVTVTPVNDAPVNSVGATATLAEDASNVALTGISVSDIDVGAGNLTVTLSVQHGTLNIATNVGGGITAGNISGGANGSGTVMITATQAQINATLAAASGLTYSPTADYNGSDALHIVTSDNGNTGTGGALTDTDDKTITITAVNDPVTTAAPATLSVAEDSTNVAVTGLSISDVDTVLAPNGVYEVTLSSTHGALTLTTLTGLIFTAGDGAADATMTFHGTLAAVNTALGTAAYTPTADYNGSAQINLSATDTFGGIVATGTGAATNDSDSVAVTVTAVNDAPVNAVPIAQTVAEDASLTLSGGSKISVSDVDVGAGTMTVTLSVAHGAVTLASHAGLSFSDNDGDATTTFTGTLAAINTALAAGVTYDPTTNYNGNDTLTVTTNDNGNTGTGGALQDDDSVAITVTAVNDTPVVAYAATLASTEQVPAVIDAAASLHDVDLDARNGGSGDYGGATLSVVRQGGANADDIFSFASSGLFTVSGGNLQAGGQTFATVTNAGGTLTISFTDSGTIATTALVNAVAQAIRYDNNNDSPPASIDLTVSLDDGAPANAGQGPVAGHPAIGTDTVHVTITDTPENTPPVVDLNGVAAGIDDTNNYQEQGVDAGLGSAITVSDAENDNITGATVALSDFQTGDEFIVHLPLPTGISVLSNVNGFLTLTGTATAAAYQTALGQIGYQSTSDDPTAGGHGTRSIGVTVSDAFGTSAPAVMTITVFGVNDEPTLSATAVNPTFTENGAAADLFSAPAASTVETGQTLTSLTLTVSNVTDGASEVLSIDGSSITLTNGNSIVTAGHGLTVNVGLAAGTATVSFTGASLSAAALQTLVDTLAYSNSSENPTAADRVVTLTQLVDSGSNVAPSDNVAALAVSSTVHVVPVNDAAVITGATTGSVTEAGGVNNGTPGTSSATGNLDDTDIDNPADTWQQVAAGAATANGYGSYALGTDGQWTYTLDDNNAAVQALNGAATLTDTFVAKTADGTQQTVTITIHAQDDAAVAHNDAVSTNEATVLSGSVIANNGSGADSDPDGPGLSVIAVNGNAGDIGAQITLASGAHLTLNANGTFSYDPNHAFDATPAPGSGASNAPALDSFTYTLSGGSMATVTVSVAGLDTNDVLRDGPGPATLQGGLGDDWYFVDQSSDVVIEHTGEGTDRVFASVSYALGASSEVELLTTAANDGTAAIDLTGSDTANFIYGNDGTNTLQGGAGDDFLAARAGDDILDGGTGNDIMAGESGNDWYFVDSPGDVIIEFAGAGNDRVFASVSYALAAQVDVETLTTTDNFGTAAIDLTGSSSANFIYGNDGANKLFGGAGDDVLASRAGNDTLDGGTGADTMIGGTGNDFYFVDQAGDVVVENPGEGDDRVFAAVSYTLAADAEVETLTTTANEGTGAIDLTGSNSANFIYGNDGANVLHGLGGDDFLASRAGNDMLDGGTGNDMLNGGAGADTFAFTTALGPNNVDTITDFASGTDKIALDHGVFDGLATGALGAGVFGSGSQATDEDQRILYDQATGNLYYDADGTGAGAAVLFAHVDPGTVIVATDFQVI